MDLNNSTVFYRKILVPIDSSKPALSSKLAEHALKIAELKNQNVSHAKSIVILLNVIEDIKQGGTIGLQAKYGNVKLAESFLNLKEQTAKDWMDSVEEDANQSSSKIRGEIIHAQGNSLGTVIVNYVNQNDIDLVVIGAGDLFRLRYLLVGGSVTGEIIKRCACPVLLVH